MRRTIEMFLVLLLAGVAQGGEVILDAQARSGIELLAEDSSTLKLEARVARLATEAVDTAHGPFVRLTIPGAPVSGAFGAPALPVLTRIVEVPQGARVTAHATAHSRATGERAVRVAAPLYPSQPPRPKSGPIPPFAYDARAYKVAGLQQPALVEVEELGQMRDRRLVLVKVSPVAHDPVSRETEVYERVTVELRLEGADLARTAALKRGFSSPWLAVPSVLVPPSLARLTPREPRASALLIVADRMFADALARFVAWKTQKGFRVNVAYTDEIGATAAKVKEHVKAQYEAGNCDFLLLVGDHQQVPAFRGATGAHVTDLPHACVAGDDNLPDLLSGRFSAQTLEQLTPQIEKTLAYERAEFADTAFLGRATLTAGWDWSHAVEWGWPQIKYAVANFFHPGNGLTSVTTFYSSGENQNVAEIIANASAGCAFLNYAAHGSEESWQDPEFTLADLAGLQNEGRYPLVVGNCCLTSKFEIDECFGEAWLRADKKGAIGYIGGTNSTYWDEDLWWANGLYAIPHPNPNGDAPTMDQTGPGAYEALFSAPFSTNSGMVLAGNLAVEASTSSRKKYYWEVYMLMGDPSLRTFFGAPQEAAVTHAPALSAGATAVDVAAPEGAYVGISANGQLLSGGVVTGGAASFPVPALSSGAVTLTVTGRGMKPVIAEIPVLPPSQP